MSHQFSKKARKEPFVLSFILSPELLLIYVMSPVITPAVTDAARLVRSDPAIAARARKGNAEPLQHRGVREEAGWRRIKRWPKRRLQTPSWYHAPFPFCESISLNSTYTSLSHKRQAFQAPTQTQRLTRHGSKSEKFRGGPYNIQKTLQHPTSHSFVQPAQRRAATITSRAAVA